MDHDVMFSTPDWYPAIAKAIAANPQYGVLTVMTNRCGELAHPWQMVAGVDVNNHDVRYHRELGAKLLKQHQYQVLDVTHEKRKMNGVAIAIQRKVWDAIKVMPKHVSLVDRPSILSFDLKVHARARDLGYKVGVMRGVYCYHWYRADGVTHIS
jgi:GT2 family glycosyltransferase